MEVIGRHEAKSSLDKILQSQKPELVVVTGRRRIGKTFLVREYLSKHIIFQFTGLYQSNLHEQLERFSAKLSQTMNLSGELKTPKSWFEAFDMLKAYVQTLKSTKRKVIFLDEFPWMATNRSRFLTAFTDFWNTFGATRPDLIIIVCGSSASWMINNVLRNKGGLYNRVTSRIFLPAFSLREVKELLVHKNISMTEMDMIRLYMVLGGIPFYLDLLSKGESLVQFIDRVFFEKNSIMQLEYGEIFKSLFDDSHKHHKIIELLNTNKKGLSRNDILEKTGLNSGGGLTSILEDLEASDFISGINSYGRKNKDKIYRIKDHYIQFYLTFVEKYKPGQNNVWEKISNAPSFVSWSGLAFENVCYEHSRQIKKALGIEGVYSEISAWSTSGSEVSSGAQIDMIIDREDNVINICEIKFSNAPFAITKEYALNLRNKMHSFQQTLTRRKALFLTFITSYGLAENKYEKELVQQSINMEQLFS
ncbi:MAG: AAA family ATPase [Saprospiraceae bacterium]|nr:AAA family ATPase [Saprospiraceae bacterium]